MTWQTKDAGTLRTQTDITVRQAGVDRRILTARVMDGGVLRTVAQFADPLTVSVAPTLVAGATTSEFVESVTTGAATAQPDGGRAPFAYTWLRIAGAGGSASALTSATTTFSAPVAPFSAINATFQVTVTDDAGQTATGQVDAVFRNLGGSGGIFL